MKSKIAFISDQASPLAIGGEAGCGGGQHVHVAELAKALADIGYEVDIYTRRDSLDLDEIVYFYPHVRVINILAGPAKPIPKEEMFMYMDEFGDMMLDIITDHNIKYNLIHAHFWLSGYVAIRIKQELGIPLVVNFHGLGAVAQEASNISDRLPAERLDIEDEIIWHADQIIATCPNEMKDLIHYYHVDTVKVEIIPCGYNPEDFHPVERDLAKATLKLSSENQYVLQLGSITPHKGVENVLRGFALLDNKFQQVQLYIVGANEEGECGTEQLQNMADLASDLGVAERVHFVNVQERSMLKYYYSAADIFVTTPWYEPFGITTLEAAACGTPVIGSHVGGLEYTIRHGDTGLLVEPENPIQLASALHDLLNNTQLRGEMTEAGVKHVSEHFNWETIADKTASQYEKLIRPMQFPAVVMSQPVRVKNSLTDAAELFKLTAETLYLDVVEASKAIGHALKNGKKILVCSDERSAISHQHFIDGMLGRFKTSKRAACAVISLQAHKEWSEESDSEDLFAQQVGALGNTGDVLVCLSVQGTSGSIIRALQQAHHQQLVCVGLLGGNGGQVNDLVHHNLCVPSGDNARIQEVHLHLCHLICDLIEQELFPFSNERHAPTLERGVAV